MTCHQKKKKKKKHTAQHMASAWEYSFIFIDQRQPDGWQDALDSGQVLSEKLAANSDLTRLKIASGEWKEAAIIWGKKRKKIAWCVLDNGPWIYFPPPTIFLLIQEGICCQISVIIYVLVFLRILLTLQSKAQCFVTRLTARQALRQTDGPAL